MDIHQSGRRYQRRPHIFRRPRWTLLSRSERSDRCQRYLRSREKVAGGYDRVSDVQWVAELLPVAPKTNHKTSHLVYGRLQLCALDAQYERVVRELTLTRLHPHEGANALWA
jgi:hypothetical protein